MISFSSTLFRNILVLIFVMYFVSGCSGSSDSSSDGALLLVDNGIGDGAEVNLATEEPFIQNRVLVSFDITVPAYHSSELSVELTWGDLKLNAMWIGDEFWSTSGEFPTETEQLLTITFYDRNGDIELARFSQEFKTGSNTTEFVQISAEQLDATLFDSDEDGANNLAELIAGTDPFDDENSLLEILDIYAINSGAIDSDWGMSVSESFESRLSEERPFFDTYEPDPDHTFSPLEVSGNVNIDAEGSGTLTYNYFIGSESLNLIGTRTHLENSISWEGEYRGYQSGSYRHTINFTNTVAIVNENTRDFTEEIVGESIGLFVHRWETSIRLIGKVLDGSPLCEPVAGTVSTMHRTNPGNVITTSISKLIDDPYWRVVSVENETETREYFVQDLRILSTDVPEGSLFTCDFVDF